MDHQKNELKILFIDDEPLHLDLLKRIIRVLDPVLDISVLSEPAKTIENILKNHYDCIVLDEKMPMISGSNLIKLIKQVKDIPCIIYTGYALDELEYESYKSGADGILEKIVNANFYPQLIETIRQTVANHRSIEVGCPLEGFFKKLVEFEVDENNRHIVVDGLETLDEHIQYLISVRDQIEKHLLAPSMETYPLSDSISSVE